MKLLGVVLLVLLAIPLIVICAIGWALAAIVLQVLILLLWIPRGRRVLFVYSDSPNWKPYIEAELLPRLPPTTAVLNWSARSTWPALSLSVWLFRFYGGSTEYNPLAIVVRPWATPRVFRFWQPFRDFKHGKAEPLHALEAEFFAAIARRRD